MLFSTNEHRIGAYLQDLMNSVETYHFLTLGVCIFFSYLCKLRGGWVGQSEFALCANWKNRTQKWTAPYKVNFFAENLTPVSHGCVV